MKKPKSEYLTEKEYLKFLSKIARADLIDQCWHWLGSRNAMDYGVFSWRGHRYLAHRVSYTIFNGPIPQSLLVRHKCDTPSCVNPKHLEVGTNADNMQDRAKRVRVEKNNGINRIDNEIVESLMPRVAKSEAFGPEFEQLLLRAYDAIFVKKLEEYAVQLPNPKVANSIRMRTYTYFRVLKKEGKRQDLIFQSQYLSMRLAGSALIFYHVNEDLDSKAIRDALGLTRGFAETGGTEGLIAPQSAVETNLDKLREIRERK